MLPVQCVLPSLLHLQQTAQRLQNQLDGDDDDEASEIVIPSLFFLSNCFYFLQLFLPIEQQSQGMQVAWQDPPANSPLLMSSILKDNPMEWAVVRSL